MTHKTSLSASIGTRLRLSVCAVYSLRPSGVRPRCCRNFREERALLVMHSETSKAAMASANCWTAEENWIGSGHSYSARTSKNDFK